MIRRLIEFSLDQRTLVIMLVVLALAFGAVAYTRLAVDVFPDITLPVFTLNAENPLLAPEEMEALVTIPIEGQMNGLPGVQLVRSSTEQGVSVVTVTFDADTDYWQDQQFVTQRLATVMPLLPPGTEPPVLTSVTTRLADVYEFALQGPDLTRLRDIAEFQLRYRLMNVPGVSLITNMGGYLRQYQVLVNPEALRQYGLTLGDVRDAIQQANDNPSGGFLPAGPTEFTVRGVGRYSSVEDIADTLVSEQGGVPVYLRQLAKITEGHQLRRGVAYHDGHQVVTVTVTKQFGANTVQVVKGVRRALAEARASGLLPPGTKVFPFYDQTTLIDSAIGSVRRAIFVGAFLVIGVIFLLLGNVRAALIVALSLPLSVLIAGSLLYHYGIGLNTMSLGGLAIAVGMMVDASIIMTENIFLRLRQRREDPLPVARAAAIEVGRPIAFATLIIVAVFLPLFLMTGLEGKLYKPLALTVSLTMLASLLVSLTLTPILSQRFLRPRAESGEADSEVWLVRRLTRVYVPALEGATRRPVLLLVIAAAVTAAVLGASGTLGREFLPQMDEGALFIPTTMTADTSLAESNRIGEQIDRVLLADPDVREVLRRTGHTEKPVGEAEPVYKSETIVNLAPPGERRDSTADIIARLRRKLGQIPGVALYFTQPLAAHIQEGLAGTPATLEVKLFGSDLDVLAQKGAQIRELMAGVRGVTDLSMDQPAGVPQLRIVIDRDAAARYGISVARIGEVIELGIGGQEVTQLLKSQRNYGVFVRLRGSAFADPKRLAALAVPTPDGGSVPLSAVARLVPAEGPNVIRRESMTRRIAISCDVTGRDLASVVRDIRTRLRGLSLPQGYYVTYGGNYESAQRALHSLLVATLAALFIVYILLFLALGSLSRAGLILATLPVALVGGILSMLIFGQTLNVSSGVGFIALLGIAVQNGLVLVTQTEDLRRGGAALHDAVREASVHRLRPKLMTAASAMLGLLPLALFSGAGADVERPLAIVMIGGLITSTLFTLVVLPVAYEMMERGKAGFRGLAVGGPY